MCEAQHHTYYLLKCSVQQVIDAHAGTSVHLRADPFGCPFPLGGGYPRFRILPALEWLTMADAQSAAIRGLKP